MDYIIKKFRIRWACFTGPLYGHRNETKILSEMKPTFIKLMAFLLISVSDIGGRAGITLYLHIHVVRNCSIQVNLRLGFVASERKYACIFAPRHSRGQLLSNFSSIIDVGRLTPLTFIQQSHEKNSRSAKNLQAAKWLHDPGES